MIAVDIEPPSSDAFLSRHRDLVPDVNNPYPVVDIPNVMERVEARICRVRTSLRPEGPFLLCS